MSDRRKWTLVHGQEGEGRKGPCLLCTTKRGGNRKEGDRKIKTDRGGSQRGLIKKGEGLQQRRTLL